MINIDTSIDFYSDLLKLIPDFVLNKDKAEISEFYNGWNEFINVQAEYKNFTRSDDVIHVNQNISSGISLKPTWFGKKLGKRVVVLGIDPLRNRMVFKREKARLTKDVVIGTRSIGCQARLRSKTGNWKKFGLLEKFDMKLSDCPFDTDDEEA